MSNQYSRISRKNILIKMNRKKSPVTSAVQLAREFGETTVYTRRTPNGAKPVGYRDEAVPAAFRAKVIALVGEQVWNQLRQDEFVNLAYR